MRCVADLCLPARGEVGGAEQAYEQGRPRRGIRVEVNQAILQTYPTIGDIVRLSELQ